jgi:hypothetical protein
MTPAFGSLRLTDLTLGWYEDARGIDVSESR